MRGLWRSAMAYPPREISLPFKLNSKPANAGKDDSGSSLGTFTELTPFRLKSYLKTQRHRQMRKWRMECLIGGRRVVRQFSMGYCTRTLRVSPTPPQLFLCFLGSLTFSGICTRKQGKTRHKELFSLLEQLSLLVLTSISAFPATSGICKEK
jgi:hypothetical protein